MGSWFASLGTLPSYAASLCLGNLNRSVRGRIGSIQYNDASVHFSPGRFVVLLDSGAGRWQLLFGPSALCLNNLSWPGVNCYQGLQHNAEDGSQC